MIIKYTNFSDGIHQIIFEEPVEKVGLDNLFTGIVYVNCRMDKSPHQIVLNCDTRVNSNLVCDRCGTEFLATLNSNFQMSYIFTKGPKVSEEYNVKYLTSEQDKIDISEDVYEYAELSVPMKILCSEDCKGLCPICGKNLNIEKCNCHLEKNTDIWEPLKKLKSKN